MFPGKADIQKALQAAQEALPGAIKARDDADVEHSRLWQEVGPLARQADTEDGAVTSALYTVQREIRDHEQQPSYQLREYVNALDSVYAAIRDNIEVLYHDHFIETCADWVVPYIADLLGTSHLSGVINGLKE